MRHWHAERQRLGNLRTNGVILDMLLMAGFLLALAVVSGKRF